MNIYVDQSWEYINRLQFLSWEYINGIFVAVWPLGELFFNSCLQNTIGNAKPCKSPENYHNNPNGKIAKIMFFLPLHCSASVAPLVILVEVPPGHTKQVTCTHRLNMELNLQSYLGSCVPLYSLVETPQLPPSLPHLGSYTRALLVSQDRRNPIVTPCLHSTHL